MGDHEEWSQPRGGLSPNGLLPNAGPLLDTLDSVRWLKAEERTAELIACIQPNQPSEERRNAVADYVQRLIMKCFPCQVFTFGSVPLKTYLPDGDIDLTAFSNSANLKDSWASEVRDLLETEEKNENAEFHVKEVQYIQAEVKIIKCLVENIVVDISFNQLGGLCTLCFLEEVDNLINNNHLFKRSIILIKAWCYYESRILGAHHGLISTYALETLVLYIFHVFNNSFAGPLEVLYRFLEFFSNFDWENFCVSLWGPVPISSLPDVTAEAPRKDSGELLLNKVFLDACSSVYAVFPGGQDSPGQTFVSKHFNVIDPLRVTNNLGRSVSKGNFFRIRSAFAFGAKRLARLLDCPQENLVSEVNQFFTNTWERHGSGIRPDAPGTNSVPLTSQPLTDNSKMNSTSKKLKQFVSGKPQTAPESARAQKGHGILRGQKNLFSGQIVNDIQRSPFARTQSSPELTDSYNDVPKSGNTQTAPRKNNIDGSVDSNNGPNVYQNDLMSEQMSMHQEEQDLVNMMASSGIQGYNGQMHMPMGQIPFPFSPSFLAGMGYAQRNFPNFPMMDPMQFSSHHGYISPQFFSGIGIPNSDGIGIMNSDESLEAVSTYTSPEIPTSSDHDAGYEPEKPETVAAETRGMSYIPPPRRVGASGGVLKSQQKSNKEKRGPMKEEHSHNSHYSDSVSNSDERIASSRMSSSAHSNSVKSKTSSESSWDETSTIAKKEKRGKKAGAESSSASYLKGKTMFEATSAAGEDDVDSEPTVFGHNRERAAEGSGAVPLTFYPTGPPVPFLTMLPFYNVPSQPGPSAPDDVGADVMEGFRGAGPGEPAVVDILNSDFASHWQNLQFGRLCQVPRQHGYPSPLVVPPVYLQGRVPWDGPGRPLPNMNVIMNYGPRILPVQNVSRPPNVYPREDIPRYRSGTGTYLPNPNPKVAVRERPRRGNYNHDNEGNWNGNSKPRGSNRNHNRNQTEKSRGYRHESYQGQNGPVHGGSSQGYAMYSNVGGQVANGSGMMMVYPYDNNSGFGSHTESLEFGSVGPTGFSEQSRGAFEEHRLYTNSVPQRSSPDQPSSPHHQRRI